VSFLIEILNLYWIDKLKLDDPTDLCLHGDVRIMIGNEVLDDGQAGDWTVSAGVYRMLETLFSDHISGNEEHLMPCCGRTMFVDNNDKLLICGCSNGIDWSVKHEGNQVRLITEKGTEACISFDAYQTQILLLVDKVEAAYQCVSAKIFPSDFEESGHRKFWDNWFAMRQRVTE
jgi:hypothetical protein